MKLQRLQHKGYDPSIVSTCLNTEFPAPTFMHLGALYAQSMKDVKATLTHQDYLKNTMKQLQMCNIERN